jgi:hypothetical protein
MQHRLLQLAALAFLAFTLTASASMLYVDVNGTNPIPPYTNWATAALTIQDAVQASVARDQVLVADGVYGEGSANGGYSRVYVTNALTLASVHGPQATTILGSNGVRCVYVTSSGVQLNGFTVTGGGGGLMCSPDTVVTNCIIRGNTNYVVYNGTLYNCWITDNYSAGNGGGAYGGTLFNCVLSNNVSMQNGGGASMCTLYHCRLLNNRASSGGGAYGGTLVNCLLSGNTAVGGGGFAGGPPDVLSNCIVTGNTASQVAGGVYRGTLYNCLIVSNSAPQGGGVYVSGNLLFNCTICANMATNSGGGLGMYYSGGYAFLQNCILYYNTASSNANWESYGNYDNVYDACCTTPLPARAYYCPTNEPSFVDWLSGNFRLKTNSPCINSGDNFELPMTTDLDGRPRFAFNGLVDIGAYEFQPNASGLFIAWLQNSGLPTDGSADLLDGDSDGANNYQEWFAGTDPSDAASVFKLLAPACSLSGITVQWQSVTNRTYSVQRSTNLLLRNSFTSIQTKIPGQPGTTGYTDTNAVGAGPFFYRVAVQQ